jgi:hypothetical protein
MTPFLSAVVAVVVIAVGAAFVLDREFQASAPEKFTTSGARITSPGDNLVKF